jgi:hypothetical protein
MGHGNALRRPRNFSPGFVTFSKNDLQLDMFFFVVKFTKEGSKNALCRLWEGKKVQRFSFVLSPEKKVRFHPSKRRHFFEKMGPFFG